MAAQLSTVSMLYLISDLSFSHLQLLWLLYFLLPIPVLSEETLSWGRNTSYSSHPMQSYSLHFQPLAPFL